MKSTYIVNVLLMISCLGACKGAEVDPSTPNDLSGNWTGDFQTQQAGSCTWGSPDLPTTATFGLANNVLTATVVQHVGTGNVSTLYTGTVANGRVSVSKTSTAICTGVSRTYTNRFEGTINGNSLTLVSRDTVCLAQNCIFLRTIKLTRQ